MHLTAMTYNLVRVLEEGARNKAPELIHPSDKKYTEALEKRDKIAKEKGRFVNPLFFNPRIARISSYTFRLIQNAISTRKRLVLVLDSLLSKLITPTLKIVEH